MKPPRALGERWTIDSVPDDRSGLGDELSDWIRQEIDREILDGAMRVALAEQGWYEVRRPERPDTPWPPPDDALITAWLATSLRGEHRELWNVVMFELEEDAVAFRLAWL